MRRRRRCFNLTPLRDRVVRENDNGHSMLKVSDKEHSYNLTLAKGGCDLDLSCTFIMEPEQDSEHRDKLKCLQETHMTACYQRSLWSKSWHAGCIRRNVMDTQ